MRTVAPKSQSLRRFDHRPRRAVQRYVYVLDVPRSELPAYEHALTVLAVPNEDGGLRRPDKDPTVLAVVDRHLSGMVQDVQVAILTRIDDELLTIDATGCFDVHAARQLHEHEVLRVELWSVVPWVRLLVAHAIYRVAVPVGRTAAVRGRVRYGILSFFF